MPTKIFIDIDHGSWDSAVGNMAVGLGLRVRTGRAEWIRKKNCSKRDFIQAAREVVEQAIGEKMDGSRLDTPVEARNPHFAALGSAGGKKGGKARAKHCQPSAEQRSQRKPQKPSGK